VADDVVGKVSQNGSEDLREAELRARLEGLEARLSRATRDDVPEASKADGRLSGTSLGRAVRLSSELVAGVLVGGGLGLGLDHLAGTKPWGLIILLMIGFAAGVLNLVRTAGLAGSDKAGSGSPDR
jgi:ATP synthase protein I